MFEDMFNGFGTTQRDYSWKELLNFSLLFGRHLNPDGSKRRLSPANLLGLEAVKKCREVDSKYKLNGAK